MAEKCRWPKLKIGSWLPGTQDHEPVSLSVDFEDGSSLPFIGELDLKTACLVKQAFDALRQINAISS